MPDSRHTISADLAELTLSATLRKLIPSLSWSGAKKLIVNRHVLVNNVLATNDARRLAINDEVKIFAEPNAPVMQSRSIRMLHIDPDLVVVEKPPHIVTQRPDAEKDLPEEKKLLQPTLDELVAKLLPSVSSSRRNPLYVVHRLDRDTSGLMLFALSVRAREAFIDLFTRHAINRTYHAVCMGKLDREKMFDTHIIRDRGDGLRGSVAGVPPADAKRAITHIKPLEPIGSSYTLIECRLETGRTHQIRIHLAEAGHMLCGEHLYTRPNSTAETVVDHSGAPRQALHSTTLSFDHPITKKHLSFSSPLPGDLATWLNRLRVSSVVI
ncbi:MAG TPA: RluA family pseudouridine synthase [Tepidisphaeraceae bacterium]|jgi:23S rRNA pseudouridine1911/1915/1917 synthase|nr:RluA family pseudouridine synthase [Tepidisphaeraceae bacterium]